MVRNTLLIVLTLFVATITPHILQGQGKLSNFEMFIENESADDVLQVKLESDAKLLRKSKSDEDPEYQPAFMTFFLSENDSVELDVRIKPRGIFRKNHCLFPPIWVNYDSVDFAYSSVGTYDKLKLVTHCRDQSSYKQQMLIEYYIYKMYEMLTDYSFRTRLLKINYKDTVNKKEPGWNYAFFLEDLDQIAERKDAVKMESENMHATRLNRDQATIMDVFQYVIGNTDWSVVVGHNVKLVKSNNREDYAPKPIPYDFDYCGLVNASYAVPPEMLGIESVTERIYRGYCRTPEEFQVVFDMFTEKKEAMLDLFRNSEYLDKRTKAEAVAYLERSFEIVGHPKLSKSEIVDMCRTK